MLQVLIQAADARPWISAPGTQRRLAASHYGDSGYQDPESVKVTDWEPSVRWRNLVPFPREEAAEVLYSPLRPSLERGLP
jgi:hypothetical protein